jgi:mannose-6-phosphate isomerase
VIARLTGVIQPYAWGSATMIPHLLGVEPSGDPQAELWLGAHPLAPSTIDHQPLDELLARDPSGLIGDAAVRAFGPRLPFLLKVIAADQPLSLQAHPSREQAELGFAREQAAGIPRDAANRIYRDGWPKPEVLCALQETEALCGFREPAESYALFQRLGVSSAMELVDSLSSTDLRPEDRLAAVFERLLRLKAGPGSVVTEVVQAAERVAADGEFGLFARTARELGHFYPGDPGVLAALLMNRIELRPNDAIYLPAGNLHAYLRGGGVEVMANSDNVMRGGLTPKHIDVDELLSVLDFTPGFAGLVKPVEEAPGLWRYPVPAPEFALWRIESSGTPVPLPASDGARILLVTDGSLSVASNNEVLALVRGESAWISASEAGAVRGTGTAFVGGSGIF